MHKSGSPALKTKARLLAAIASTQPVAQIDTRSRREVVDANAYPWSGQCTGAVIGANQFLTAAHCLYYKAVRRLLPAEAIHILLGYVSDEYRVHRVASKYVSRRPTTRLWKIERAQMIGSFSTSVIHSPLI